MEDVQKTVAALVEHGEAQDGVMLAHTCMITAVVSVFKAKGLLSQVDVNAIFDAALTGAENAVEISSAANRRARQIIEVLAGEMAGPPKA